MTDGPGEGPARYEWPPLPILDPEEGARRLAEALQAAWDDLEAERVMVAESATMGRKELVDRWLREFQGSLDGFTDEVRLHLERFLLLHLAPRYQAGAELVAGQGGVTWTQAHALALTSLAVDTYNDFLQRAFEAERVGEAFVRAVREAARVELPKLAAGGRTAAQAADRLEERLLTEYGIDHVVYRDGAQVPVRQYAHMVARTKSAVAYSAGTLNECVAADVGYVEVFDGTECGWSSHLDPDKANGSIRSVVAAAAHPIAHPNCTRAFGPRPDVTSDEEAEAASASTTTEQRADQATVDYFVDGRNASKRPKVAGARRARLQAQRQARMLGTDDPEQIGDILARLLREQGIIPPEEN